MRIALITDGITPYVMGGMQRHSFHLARTLSRLGVEVDLYHTDKGRGLPIEELEGMLPEEKQHIRSISVPWPAPDPFPGKYLRQMAKYSEAVFALFQDRPPVDLIYAKGLTGGTFLRQKRKGLRLPPVAVKAHGYEMFQLPPSFLARLQQMMMRPVFRRQALAADWVFSYGGKITDILVNKIGVQPERVVEVTGGISGDWLAAAPSPVHAPRRFVFVGRNERRKGLPELQQLLARHPEWQQSARFTIAGPIPEQDRLSRPHVSYTGALSDPAAIQALLSESDVLICPSFSEGMPNVIIEGMARGLAVIATDVGAVRKLVLPGETGWITEAGQPDQLRAAITEAMSVEAATLQRLKARSLALVREQFTWEQIGQQLVSALGRMIDISGSGRH